jgi:hypothetical protein
MIRPILHAGDGLVTALVKFEEHHPYKFSFIFSILVVGFFLFYTPSLEIAESDFLPTEHLEFIDLDVLETPKRKTKKEITTDDTKDTVDDNNVERATGLSDADSAVDIDFLGSNVAHPKLISRLKRIYPSSAEKVGIEAIVKAQLLISPSGKIIGVDILGITLSKGLPVERNNRMSKHFANATRKMLLGAKFSPPIIDGKSVPIKMEYNLKFRLEK